MDSVALFGGSFDPPHIGHIAIVKHLLKFDEIDTIIVMPTYLNPLKKQFFAPAKTRLKWLEKIFADNKKVHVNNYEVLQKQKIPTLQSVEMLLKQYKKVFVVIGADNYATLNKWHRIDELKKKAEFIVATRGETKVPNEIKTIPLSLDISSTKLRENIEKYQEYLPPQILNEALGIYKKEKN